MLDCMDDILALQEAGRSYHRGFFEFSTFLQLRLIVLMIMYYRKLNVQLKL